jgi:hypothetical protein
VSGGGAVGGVVVGVGVGVGVVVGVGFSSISFLMSDDDDQ